MIDIVKEKLPKEYERVVLEEYYDFFSNLYGIPSSVLRGKPTFTTDLEKLSRRDFKDQILMSSIGALDSINSENIEFVTNKESDGRISAIARIRVKDTDIHIAEILFLEYQDNDEKSRIAKDIFATLEQYGTDLNIPMLCYEVPQNDEIGIDIVLENGFSFIEEPSHETSIHRTFVFEKSLEPTRNQNGCTLNRKQTQGIN